ncbi:ScbR family autoregulator-binding transcription factor [Streptomyces sp. B-S-A8]|uniref:ScbR family autoregulator-binding transcription factor n=1 Tax=Streptomyces solicavernae TaxID=3043614 RepID=A0ABT6S0M5_9ACTN|nr:ScbR family autoregulator-binding transcription factor [Streptomyces sp. B-S-A8]MDI3389979.1 ScbR family autoregulator-binding transcription factor [Streptomyces sp. B-S-A8]
MTEVPDAGGDKRTVKQERALRTRAVLVRAAAEVFSEAGFAGASVAKIAERAGLTLGAMYFHFRNKDALAREIVRMQPGRVSVPLESVGLQRAVDITLAWAYQMRDDPLLLAGARLVMDQEQFIPPEENSHGQWSDVLAEELAEAAGRRELRASVDVSVLARLLVNACTGAQMHSQMESGRVDLPDRIVETWRFLLPAVAVPSAVRRIELGEARGRAL